MDIFQIMEIEDEETRVQKIYEVFHEDTRLNHSKAARVEFLTTVRVIEEYVKPGDRILDVGAGAGEYSLYFARKGYRVSALELTDSNIRAFRAKLTPEDAIGLVQGNALDLSRYEEASFDAVLLFGPLYHLGKTEDQLRCIAQAKRVCKPGGKLFFAFISNDFVILTEFRRHPDYFTDGDYDKETFRLQDFPFVFHTVDACRALLREGGIRILREVASDGASEFLEEKINALDDAGFEQYLRYHFYICEKPELLGMSNHLLFVGEA
ncbi:MAG: class I SAM-dependent methyltransferase [Candidatus Faecousia sp.]|nr:class I SAM-dependent methyltransferase [Clostridiales bacterium]MDY6179981.1 class I SAM-dependent methyltransferase [Candidatus Faecousia sp.]